jgi:hypothetical protein
MKKQIVLRRTAMAVAVSTVFLLSACGGGGGGGGYTKPDTPPGGGGPSGPALSSAVPFATPTSLGTINPLVGAMPGTLYAMTQNYTADLTGSGAENVIVAGATSSGVAVNSANWKNNAIQVFGWSNGQLVNQTSQWFSGTDNVITGTNNIQFGNFNGNGRKSMYVGPFTDGNTINTQAEIFVNNGSSFTRYNINLPYNLSSSGSTTFMYNGVENIVALDYGPNTTFFFGSNTNNFRAASVNNMDRAGSAIASGDFLGNGTTTFVITDDNNSSGANKYSTRLYNWNLDPVTGAVTMNMIGILPMPILETAQFDSILNAYPNVSGGQLRSNQIGIITYDFDESGKPSLVVLGMPSNLDAPIHSAVQFLKNNGTGTFTDVTGTTLTGYNYNMAASNMTVVDLLNNGLSDIVVSGAGGAQVLMQTSKGKYVSSFANVISDFQNQVASLQSGAGVGNVINFVKGPNGQLYLLDAVDTQQSGTQKTLYLSALGNSSSALNANQTITAMKQLWPWMTDASANAVLAATGKTWFGATIIDDTALWSPYGSLSVATAKGLAPIQGYVAGVEFGAGDGQITAMDSLGRNFNVNLSGMRNTAYTNSFNMNSEHIDQYELTSHSEYLISGSVNTYNGIRIGSEDRNIGNTLGMDAKLGPTLGLAPRNYTIGLPAYWRSNDGRWSAGVQYTTLNSNPWVAFGGAWGQITQTANFDHAVRYTHENGFTAVAGTTYTTTNLIPGLITNVAPIAGAWGEAGYKIGNFGVYAGVKPVLFSGSVTANLPTSVDNVGNIVYTRKNLAIQNQTTGYARALWSTDIQKNVTYRVSGAAMTNGQYRLMNELRIFF